MSITTPVDPTFGDLIRRHLANPDRESLDDLRRVIVGSSSFDPDLNPIATTAPLIEVGDYRAAAERLAATLPGAALNPATHDILARCLTRLGDDRGAERELRMARLAVTGILSTGDGTREAPWSVLRVADEYDILRVQRVESRHQEVTRDGGRLLDRHVITGGTEAWFEILDRAATTVGVER